MELLIYPVRNNKLFHPLFRPSGSLELMHIDSVSYEVYSIGVAARAAGPFDLTFFSFLPVSSSNLSFAFVPPTIPVHRRSCGPSALASGLVASGAPSSASS